MNASEHNPWTVQIYQIKDPSLNASEAAARQRGTLLVLVPAPKSRSVCSGWSMSALLPKMDIRTSLIRLCPLSGARCSDLPPGLPGRGCLSPCYGSPRGLGLCKCPHPDRRWLDKALTLGWRLSRLLLLICSGWVLSLRNGLLGRIVGRSGNGSSKTEARSEEDQRYAYCCSLTRNLSMAFLQVVFTLEKRPQLSFHRCAELFGRSSHYQS